MKANPSFKEVFMNTRGGGGWANQGDHFFKGSEKEGSKKNKAGMRGNQKF